MAFLGQDTVSTPLGGVMPLLARNGAQARLGVTAEVQGEAGEGGGVTLTFPGIIVREGHVATWKPDTRMRAFQLQVHS
jgi:hypothetical protein